MNFDELFQQFKNCKVAVIGDVMLDSYLWGHVERISPEAPVPVVTLNKREFRIGGAGNVALNLASLGAQVQIFSVTGNDDDGKILEKLLAEKNIGTAHLIKTKERITTNKSRIISRNQQMMRLDAETTKDLSPENEINLIETIEKYIEAEKPAALIFEDYNKGVLTEHVIAEIISLGKKHRCIIAVDPKRKNFFSYKDVDIFKPNLKEVREGLNLLLENINIDTLKDIHKQLAEKLHHGISLITLSEKGVFYNDEKLAQIVPSHIRNIADVSGAGDTVIAVAALVFAVTKDIHLTAGIANIAGGLVCEEVGTVAINKDQLLTECKLLLQ